MADVQFDISMKNEGTATAGLTLFSPVNTAAMKSNKYSFTTPYTPTYPINTVFTLIDDAGTNEITLSAVSTMQEVVDLLNGLSVGTFILAYNDVTNGNVFNLLSQRNPTSLSIDNNDYLTGTFVNVQTVLEAMHSLSHTVFPDTDIVIIPATDGVVHYSNDDGLTFTPITMTGSVVGDVVGQIKFISPLIGFAVTDSLTESKIFTTIDGGLTWSLVNTYVNYTFTALWMFDALNGFVYGRDHAAFNQKVFKTIDGGASLTPVQTIGDAGNGIFQFVSSTHGFIFLYGSGFMIKTVDGGLNWTTEFPGNSNAGFAIDENNIWVVGNAGVVIVSSNGGASWVNKNIATANNLYSVHAFTPLHIIVGRQARQWVRTIDGGTTWVNTVIAPGGSALVASFRDQYKGIAHDSVFEIYRYS